MDVSLAGNYAYLAEHYDDLLIVDISNPESLCLAGQIQPGHWGGVFGVVTEGSYAYCSNRFGDFYIIDVSQPNNPRIVARLSRAGEGEIWHMVKVGNYVYAIGEIGLCVFDVTVPEVPQEIGGWGGWFDDYYGQYFQITSQQNFLYLSDGDFVILDILNPTTPRELGSFTTRGYTYGVAIQDGFAFLTNYASAAERESLLVINITNKSNLYLLTGINTPQFGYSIAVSGEYIFVAAGRDGLIIYKLETKWIIKE